MPEYIEREKAIEARSGCNENCAECDFAIEGDSWCSGGLFVVDLLRIPAADVVSRDCYEQILAENETMKKMLAQVGKRPGDSMEDLKWVKYEPVKDDDPYKPLWPNWED